jgi:2-succinyl-5-enolpyruvyl-6-hydroxy-3-cyclohexene-1-carboxylate synthase
VVVAGSNWWMASSEVAQLAQRLGWPLLAEPTSGLRRPGWSLAAGQSLIASTAFLESRRPEVVLQIGATPTTRASQAFVAAADRLIVVDLFHPDPDPERQANWRLATNPDRLAAGLMGRPIVRDGDPIGFLGLVDDPERHHEHLLQQRIEPAPDGWLTSWMAHDERARHAMDDVLDATDEPTELRLARDLAASVPESGTLFVGNSMPIRDLDVAMAPRNGLQVLANRGASGIDGLVSTALGVATADIGPTVALIGDLSLLYDAGALLWNGQRLPSDLVIIVPNNRGGAIFGSLDQRVLPERDMLFVTPQDVDLAALSAAAGVGHERLERMSDLANIVSEAHAAGGIRVVEVPTPAERSRRQRIDVRAAVDAALAGP